MAYGRALTTAEWNKAVKTLNYNRIAHLPTGDIIIPWLGTSYKSYSLRSEDGNCIITTWDLDRIKKIVC